MNVINTISSLLMEAAQLCTENDMNEVSIKISELGLEILESST